MKTIVFCATILCLELVSSYPFADPLPNYYGDFNSVGIPNQRGMSQQIPLSNIARSQTADIVPNLALQHYIQQENLVRQRQNFENMILRTQEEQLQQQQVAALNQHYANQFRIPSRPIESNYMERPHVPLLNTVQEPYSNFEQAPISQQYSPANPQPLWTQRVETPQQMVNTPVQAQENKPVAQPEIPAQQNPTDQAVQAPPRQDVQNIALNPRVQQVLATTPLKKRYLVLHPNGTVEHIDKIEHIVKNNPRYVLLNAGSIRKPSNTEVTPPKTVAQSPVSQQEEQPVAPITPVAPNTPVQPIEPLASNVPAPNESAQSPPETLDTSDGTPSPPTSNPVSTDQPTSPIAVGPKSEPAPIPEPIIPEKPSESSPPSTPEEQPPQSPEVPAVSEPTPEEPSEPKTAPSTFINEPVHPSEQESSPAKDPVQESDSYVTKDQNSTESSVVVIATATEPANPASTTPSAASEDTEHSDSKDVDVTKSPSQSGETSETSPIVIDTDETAQAEHNKSLDCDVKPNIPQRSDIDLMQVKSDGDPVVWFRTKDLNFWDKLSSGKETYDILYFFNVARVPRVTKDTKTIVHANGTVVEEITETIYEDDETPPKVVTSTKITHKGDESKR